MKIKIFALLIILLSSKSFSQTDRIQIDLTDVFHLMFKIDSASVKIPTKEFKIVFYDTIVNIKSRNSMIETKSTLCDGTKLLDIKYYLENNNLIIIETQEKSQKDKFENYTLSWIFKVKDESITDSISGHSVAACGINDSFEDIYQTYVYNKSWNKEYLEKFVIDLYRKIKNYR
jgi:hypothetical protein